MPTAAQIAAAKAKAQSIVKVKLANYVSTSTGGNLEEIERMQITDAIKVGCKMGKVFITKPNPNIEGSGGKPGVYMGLPESILAKFEVAGDGDSIVLWFHSSARAILEENGKKLSKRMDIVEINNVETEEHSYIVTGRDVDITTSETTVDDLAD